MSEKVCIVYHDMLTVYGHGVSCCVKALFENKTAFLPVSRFKCAAQEPGLAACFPENLFPGREENICENAVAFLLKQMPPEMLTTDALAEKLTGKTMPAGTRLCDIYVPQFNGQPVDPEKLQLDVGRGDVMRVFAQMACALKR